MLLDLGEGSGGRGNGSPAPGRPPPSSLHASCVLKSTPLNAFASLQCAVSTQPVDARAVCDTSGARGGFFRRRGRAADATAARPMHAPSCASLCVCLHHLAVVCTAIVLRADPISTCKGKKCERCLEPGNPNRRSPEISDPRVGPPLRYRPDKFSRRNFCSSYDAAVQPSDESRKNDRVFTCQRKRKNFEIFSTCSDAGDIEAADVGWREAGMARPPWVKSRKND